MHRSCGSGCREVAWDGEGAGRLCNLRQPPGQPISQPGIRGFPPGRHRWSERREAGAKDPAWPQLSRCISVPRASSEGERWPSSLQALSPGAHLVGP